MGKDFSFSFSFSFSAQKDLPVSNMRCLVKVVFSLLNQANPTVEMKRETELAVSYF